MNLAAAFLGTGSLGEAGRLAAIAFDSAGTPVALNQDIPGDESLRDAQPMPLSEDNPYRFNLTFYGLVGSAHFAWRNGERYFGGHYNIGFIPWENEQLPTKLANTCDYFNEIWTPSTFCREALSKRLPVPVHTMLHPILPREPYTGPRSPLLDRIPANATVFLFVFGLDSGLERKNPIGAMEAFVRAFKPQDNAWLVVKASFGPSRAHFLAQAEPYLTSGANIRIIEERLSREDLDTLTASCDCYVSMHRSEGFGLSMAEAMASGKPVIATNYSGNTDYMTSENSYLVDYDMVPVYEPDAFFEEHWRWANPNLDQAAALMRRVHESPDEARKIGETARMDTRRLLSPEAIGAQMTQRLGEISESL